MPASLISSVLLFASQLTTVAPSAVIHESIEPQVASEALVQGQTGRAVAVLQAQLRQAPDDPATLINLGAAYVQQGDAAGAERAYRAAAASGTRYQVKLANGGWVDSHQAAVRALQSFEHSSQTALNQ